MPTYTNIKFPTGRRYLYSTSMFCAFFLSFKWKVSFLNVKSRQLCRFESRLGPFANPIPSLQRNKTFPNFSNKVFQVGINPAHLFALYLLKRAFMRKFYSRRKVYECVCARVCVVVRVVLALKTKSEKDEINKGGDNIKERKKNKTFSMRVKKKSS